MLSRFDGIKFVTAVQGKHLVFAGSSRGDNSTVITTQFANLTNLAVRPALTIALVTQIPQQNRNDGILDKYE